MTTEMSRTHVNGDRVERQQDPTGVAEAKEIEKENQWTGNAKDRVLTGSRNLLNQCARVCTVLPKHKELNTNTVTE